MESETQQITLGDQRPSQAEIAEKVQGIAEDYLGSGYDVCGEYADGISIKKKIFDLEKVPKNDIRRLSNRSANFFTVSGESMEEYQNSITVKVNAKVSYGLFTGSVKSSFSTTDLSISESSYVSVELCMRYETWKLQTTSTEYMYPEVLKDFKTQDGKWLIEQYGGGVLMGMDIGGRWIDNFAVSKLYKNSTTDVSVTMEAAYGTFVSGKGSTEISKAVKSEESIASRRVNVIGGNPAFAPGDLDKWQLSVEETPAFMNFTRDGLVMIWELFPEYEEKLKSGFDEYAKEHQLDIDQKSVIRGMYIEGLQYASDAGSGAKKNLQLYKPPISDSYTYIGVNGNYNRVLVLKEISNKFGAIREPIDWQPVWNDHGSHKSHDYNCWMPVGPPGFVALGIFCRFGVSNQNPPSKDEATGLVVVHSSLVEPCEFQDPEIWRDHGTGANADLRLGRLPDMTIWPAYTNFPEAGVLPSKYKLKDKYITNTVESLGGRQQLVVAPQPQQPDSVWCCCCKIWGRRGH